MFKKLCDYLGYENTKYTLHSARAWLPTCASQLGWSEGDRRRLGHWAPGSVMMETYDRAVCTSELRLRGSIFHKITDENWEPEKEFEAPAVKDSPAPTLVGGSAITTVVKAVTNDNPSEGGPGCGKGEPGETLGLSDEDDTSSSSITRGKTSVLSEVDIADLYGEN